MSLCILYSLYTFLVVIFLHSLPFLGSQHEEVSQGPSRIGVKSRGISKPKTNLYKHIMYNVHNHDTRMHTISGARVGNSDGEGSICIHVPATAASTLYNAYSVPFLKGNH